MLSGTQVLQTFDERLSRAEREAAALQREADGLAARRDALRATEAEALRELARLRLADLEKGDAALQELDEAGARVRALLEKRFEAAATAERDLAERRSALEAATAARDAESERVRAAEEEAEQLLAAARERLAADPEWRRLRATAEETARVAQHAAQKARFARQDREAKGKPYMDDPLFAYLWNRGYGTPSYRAGRLTRLLDRWVARVARYEPARRDYALLTELPERLAAHATRMQEAASAAATELATYESRVAGIQEPPETLRDALERAEDAVEAAHAALEEAERHRSALVSGEDDATREAMAVLERALAQESLRELRAAAMRTPTPQDDEVVARLERAGAERVTVERLLQERQADVQEARRRVQELVAIRHEMRQRGYTRDRWSFGSGALVGALLSELLRGALTRDRFWDRMGDHRMPPGPWGHGPWDGDDGGWGGGPWGGGSGGGFGGGGFRTGGSFGGGGFKTGGSF